MKIYVYFFIIETPSKAEDSKIELVFVTANSIQESYEELEKHGFGGSDKIIYQALQHTLEERDSIVWIGNDLRDKVYVID